MVQSPADLYALTLPQLSQLEAHGSRPRTCWRRREDKNTTLPRLL